MGEWSIMNDYILNVDWWVIYPIGWLMGYNQIKIYGWNLTDSLFGLSMIILLVDDSNGIFTKHHPENSSLPCGGLPRDSVGPTLAISASTWVPSVPGCRFLSISGQDIIPQNKEHNIDT